MNKICDVFAEGVGFGYCTNYDADVLFDYKNISFYGLL